MPHLMSYAGSHVGAHVIVCGCGPSLTELTEPERYLTIGVNDVGRRFHPDYLVVVNPTRQFRGDRFSFVRRSRARAIFTQLDLGLDHPRVVRFRLGRFGGTDPPSAGHLHYTQNSPYVAVGLAALMGATRIGLLGVDFTDHHFFGRTGKHPLVRRLAEIDEQYRALAEALSGRGVSLVNLSGVSRLSGLPRATLATMRSVTRDLKIRPTSSRRKPGTGRTPRHPLDPGFRRDDDPSLMRRGAPGGAGAGAKCRRIPTQDGGHSDEDRDS